MFAIQLDIRTLHRKREAGANGGPNATSAITTGEQPVLPGNCLRIIAPFAAQKPIKIDETPLQP